MASVNIEYVLISHIVHRFCLSYLEIHLACFVRIYCKSVSVTLTDIMNKSLFVISLFYDTVSTAEVMYHTKKYARVNTNDEWFVSWEEKG